MIQPSTVYKYYVYKKIIYLFLTLKKSISVKTDLWKEFNFFTEGLVAAVMASSSLSTKDVYIEIKVP